MNDLNSILLEGAVTAKPLLLDTDSGEKCAPIVLENVSRARGRAIHIVMTWGSLARVAASELKRGQVIRVVGYLENGKKSGSYVKAEHWEAKTYVDEVKILPLTREVEHGAPATVEARAAS